MACASLTALLKDCGSYNKAGLNKIYMVAYADLTPVSGSTEPYAVSVGGVVNQIGFKASKKFVKVDISSKSGVAKDTFEKNDNGSVSFTEEFSFSIDGFSSASKVFAESLVGNPVVVLSQLKSGKWAIQGLSGALELKSASLTVDSGNNGRTFTLSGDSDGFTAEVDVTIVPSIIS